MSKLGDVLKNVLKSYKEMTGAKSSVENNEKKGKALSKIDALHREYKDKTLADVKDLQLEKLDYTAPGDDELMREAERSLKDKYSQKRTDAVSSADKRKRTIIDALKEAERSAEIEKRAVDENYGKASADVENSAIKRGVARSSIAQGAINELAASGAAKKQEIDGAVSEKRSTLSDRLSAVDEELKSLLSELDESEKRDVEDAFSKLKQESEKRADEVKKYNNSVKEKEQNYALKTFDAPTRERLDEIKKEYELEKLKIALDYYLSIGDKAAAFDEFLGDGDMKEYLGSYYDYMSNILRNRAAKKD